MSNTRIRLVRTHAEFRQCEQLQKTVWGGLSVSSEVMTVTQKYGGAVLGAFERGRLTAFLYAFLARRNGRAIHWSHMMAVGPRHRNRGLGFRLKLAHRELALGRGIRSICWTFDPLQSRNATLNIAHLRAEAEEYIPDCYGHFPSRIEKGLPSDRFVVNWRVSPSRVYKRVARSRFTLDDLTKRKINETTTGPGGFLENRRIYMDLRDDLLLVEIPFNTDEIRANDIHLALRWRLETRRIFQSYLRAGYVVETFIPPNELKSGRCFYRLKWAR